MNTKLFTSAAALAIGMAGAASAQVADSFDNLVGQIMVNTELDTAVFSGAVNVADVDGSVDITAGSDLAPGSLSIAVEARNITENNNIVEARDIDAGDIAIDAAGIAVNGVGTAAALAGNAAFSSDDSTITTFDELSDTSFFANGTLTVEPITQNFASINTVAAGALNDTTMDLTEQGAMVMASAEAGTAAASAESLTGGSTGFITGSLNTGLIDGSVTMDVTNANVGFDFASAVAGDALAGVGGINTTAAGALNTAAITMNVMGGEGRDTDATAGF